ncbi:hypothetical protein PR002_g22530 [Phytophthora rubi]|uniref:Uncharacterized protein n=1 Tax=Phytophthora rubi TaxID=129364 RepID=A0A6A3IS82_9STRA|nr:hypothetical protein PR002_g22530 [Phytophthora rubi]
MARGGKRGPDDNESSTRKRRRTADPPPANNATAGVVAEYMKCIGVNSVLGNSADVAQIGAMALVVSEMEGFVA